MKKTVEHRKGIQVGQNTFGQTTMTETEYDEITITGTLGERMAYSSEAAVAVERGPETEHLFNEWDEDSRFAVIRNGEVVVYEKRIAADVARGIIG